MHRRNNQRRRTRRHAQRVTQQSDAIQELLSAITTTINELDTVDTRQPEIFPPTSGCFGNNATRVRIELVLPDGWSGNISAVVGGESLRDVSAIIDQEVEPNKVVHTFSYDSGEVDYDSIALD